MRVNASIRSTTSLCNRPRTVGQLCIPVKVAVGFDRLSCGLFGVMLYQRCAIGRVRACRRECYATTNSGGVAYVFHCCAPIGGAATRAVALQCDLASHHATISALGLARLEANLCQQLCACSETIHPATAAPFSRRRHVLFALDPARRPRGARRCNGNAWPKLSQGHYLSGARPRRLGHTDLCSRRLGHTDLCSRRHRWKRRLSCIVCAQHLGTCCGAPR